ncbi:recombinase family protein [Mycobacteroides abscessus]|uniref:recombinase family protein n=1 Tax=Mycobacteroides abscessus TaxID=36809 RepID=UPI000C2602AA
MRAALYIRVSTQEQVQDGFSISAQRERLTAFVHSQDWEIVDYYIDEGQSAKDLERPHLQRLIQDVEEKNIDVVLVYRLDRLTRSVTDLYKLLDHFDKHKTAFRSATEVYDTTTAMGRLFITLVAALAQWERENLAERVRVGMQQMVKEGKWHGGIVPYGYEWNKGESLEIVDHEAKIVKSIYDYYISGKGDHNIAGILNRMGYQTRNGNDWLGKGVRDILQNPVYAGHLRYMGEIFDNFVPAIITDEIFDLAKRTRERRQAQHPRRNASTYIFSGVLKCSRCGSWMNGKASYGRKNHDYDYNYYMCVSKLTGACDMPLINAETVEESFLEYCQHLHDETTSLEVAVGIDETADLREEIKDLHRSLDTVKKRRRKWQLAFASEAITLEELKELTEEDRVLEEEIQIKINSIKTEMENVSKTPEEIAIILQDFLNNWNHLNVDEKKNYLKILVKEIYVDADSERPNQWRKRQVHVQEIDFY